MPVNIHKLLSCPAGRAYEGDPQRHPSYLVHCFKPFNGETPHQLLSDSWLTPAELFYVRNHLPVPTQLRAEHYT
jgi:sulfite oxidase